MERGTKLGRIGILMRGVKHAGEQIAKCVHLNDGMAPAAECKKQIDATVEAREVPGGTLTRAQSRFPAFRPYTGPYRVQVPALVE